MNQWGQEKKKPQHLSLLVFRCWEEGAKKEEILKYRYNWDIV
jgi:hypothetical protein